MSAGVTLPPKLLVAAAAACLALTSTASAEDKVKIGIITTLSAAAGAVPGQQQRNGFELAVKMLGGKLGGREAEILVADDELKPDIAVTKVKAFVDRDKVAFVVGPIFSNILAAIVKPVTEANVFLISPNAGTSSFAGKNCNPNLFVTSYQNDQVHEVLGQCARVRHEEGRHHCAELSGRQRCGGRLQAQVHRRDC
jgi:branched-chain amino acid transport system substrate-binding protein